MFDKEKKEGKRKKRKRKKKYYTFQIERLYYANWESCLL